MHSHALCFGTSPPKKTAEQPQGHAKTRWKKDIEEGLGMPRPLSLLMLFIFISSFYQK
jgi:hypothetical protein